MDLYACLQVFRNLSMSNSTFLNWKRLNSIVKDGSIYVGMLDYLSSGMIARYQWIALEESYIVYVQSKSMELKE